MPTLVILILWTWGLTPSWVNVIGTVLMSLNLLINFYNSLPDKK